MAGRQEACAPIPWELREQPLVPRPLVSVAQWQLGLRLFFTRGRNKRWSLDLPHPGISIAASY